MSCCGRPVEDERVLEEASPILLKADRRDFQARFHLAVGAIVAMPHRPGRAALRSQIWTPMWASLVALLRRSGAHFRSGFRARFWSSKLRPKIGPSIIIYYKSQICVVKMMTEKRPKIETAKLATGSPNRFQNDSITAPPGRSKSGPAPFLSGPIVEFKHGENSLAPDQR